jgi:hypothetical protein
MCGYGRPRKEIDDTLKALGKTPLVLGAIVFPYEVKSRDYPGYIGKTELLRLVSDATGGVLFFDLNTFDGRTFTAAGEVSRLIADYENLFVRHHKDNSLVTVTGIDPGDVTVFADGKARLVMVFNEGKVKKTVRIVNRRFDSALSVYDYYADKNLGNVQEISAEIPPEDVKVFYITNVMKDRDDEN